MPFATAADLLARSNARRLAQLAVPADLTMPPLDAFRALIEGGDLTGYTLSEQEALQKAGVAIADALNDANALLLSYGIPQTVQTTLLARLCSTVALYYLQGAERMTDDMQHLYDGAIDTLKAHASGKISLIPAADLPVNEAAGAEIISNPSRYGVSVVAGFDVP